MYQKLTLVGRLGRDPEMRYTPDGKAVSNFSVAVDQGFGDNKSTMWVRVSCWGKLAETASQWLSKGDIVALDGELKAEPVSGGPRIWTANDGQPRASFEMTAYNLRFVQLKKKAASAASSQDGFEDIPF